MRPSVRFALLLVASPCWGGAGMAAERASPSGQVLAVVGATVHTGTGAVIEDATVLVRGGRIAEVGRAGAIAVPVDAAELDAHGQHVAPGFVALRSHLSLSEDDLRELRAVDGASAIDAWDPFARDGSEALAAGVTLAGTQLLDRDGVSGLGAIVRVGDVGAEAPLAADSHLVLSLAPLDRPSTSASRLEDYLRLRRRFLEAQRDDARFVLYERAAKEWNARLAEAKNGSPDGPTEGDAKEAGQTEERKPTPELPKAPRRPGRSRDSEVFSRAMRCELPVVMAAHRPDDVGYAQRLADEFGFRLTIVGGAGRLESAEAVAAVAVAPLLGDPGFLPRDAAGRALHALIESGARWAIAPSLERPGALRLEACAALRWGATSEDALRAITLEPARILGVDDRYGSIEVGKAADLVFLDGPPLDARSRILRVIADGVVVAPPSPSTSLRENGAAETDAAAEMGVPRGTLLTDPSGDTTVLRGATLITVGDKGVERRRDASIVLQGGVVRFIGDAADAMLAALVEKEDVRVVDLAGRWLTPGLVDAHARIGVVGAADELASAVEPDLLLTDALDPWSAELPDALSRGVTAAAIAPGDANVIGGAVQLVRLVPGRLPLATVGERVTKASLVPAVSLPRYPAAYGSAVDLFQRWCVDAPPGRVCVRVGWPGQAALALDALAGRESALVESPGWGERDWMRWSTSPGSRPSLVILAPLGVAEPEARARGAAILARAGVPFAFSSDGARVSLVESAVRAIASGAPRDEVFLGLTDVPARFFGAGGAVGRVAPGAFADLVAWTGEPLSLGARVERVWVGGMEVYAADAETTPVPARAASRRATEVRWDVGERRGDVDAEGDSRAPSELPISEKTGEGGTIRIHATVVATGDGDVFAPGVIDIVDGTIRGVGPADGEPRPGDLVVDGHVVPGFIDAGSDIAVRGPRVDEFREMTPTYRIAPAIDLGARELRRALARGVTTVAVSPGGRNVIGGFGAVIDAGGGILSDRAFLGVSLSQEADRGNRTLRAGRPDDYRYRIPTTRMGTVFLARRAFFEATNALDDALALDEVGIAPYLTGEERESLRESLSSRTVRVVARTEVEIGAALRLADEFGIGLQIEGGAEASRFVPELERRRDRVALILDAEPPVPDPDEIGGPDLHLPEHLAASGIPFAFASGDAADVEHLRERATFAVRHGLAEEHALRALTAAAADLLRVGDRVGRIAPDRVANLVATSGSPFDARSRILWVMVGGRAVRVAAGPAANSPGRHDAAPPESIPLRADRR